MNAMAQQKGLGRGLGALLGDYNQAPEGPPFQALRLFCRRTRFLF